jgi:hypothetical protein
MLIDKVVLDIGKTIPFKIESLHERTYYHVELKFSESNTKHDAILTTGFGDGKYPNRVVTLNNYITIFNDSYDAECIVKMQLKDLYWFRVKQTLFAK